MTTPLSLEETAALEDAGYRALEGEEDKAAMKLVAALLAINPTSAPAANHALKAFGGLLYDTVGYHEQLSEEFREKHSLAYANGAMTDADVAALPDARQNAINLVSVLLSAEVLLKSLRAAVK